jgi:hypothetical protein
LTLLVDYIINIILYNIGPTEEIIDPELSGKYLSLKDFGLGLKDIILVQELENDEILK